MTVGNLIELLKEHDPNLPVMVRGYEGGVDDVNVLEKIKVVLNSNTTEWYYGDHEPYDLKQLDIPENAVTALFLQYKEVRSSYEN